MAVHPRACGERAFVDYACRRAAGSSPRVRGTRLQVLFLIRVQRFIPARAGNAAFVDNIDEEDAVHPRACGERRAVVADVDPIGGSSPRVRGTPGEHANG